MCIASAISDDFGRGYPWGRPVGPIGPVIQPEINPYPNPFEKLLIPTAPPISKEDFDALKKEVEELKELLEKAKQYDAKHDEPDCEAEEKIALAKQLGKTFDVDIESVLTKPVDESYPPNPNEIFRVISGERGELARFESEATANKFAEYVRNYSGDTNVFVLEVHPVNLSVLKYAVYVNDALVAAFVEFPEAQTFGLTVTDAADIFTPNDPKPEVRITLI
jgi:hypothetical protein